MFTNVSAELEMMLTYDQIFRSIAEPKHKPIQQSPSPKRESCGLIHNSYFAQFSFHP